MFVQLLLAERIASLHSLQFDLVVLTALALFNRKGYDTVWDVSNRICDRYLPELQA